MNSIVRNVDCMIGMSEYPNGYFDLAIVDPPYGINAPNMTMGSNPNMKDMAGSVSVANKLRKGRLNSGGGKLKNRMLDTSTIDWDDSIPDATYFDELFRVSKNQIIWGGNYFPLRPTRCIAVWDKCQPWENFSQVELAWTSFDKPASIYKLSNTGGSNKETKIHPTQKPISLYKWLISKYAIPGDKILDTHMGSQSSRIGAHEMGYDYTGFEISLDYFLSGNKRYQEAIKQQVLF